MRALGAEGALAAVLALAPAVAAAQSLGIGATLEPASLDLSRVGPKHFSTSRGPRYADEAGVEVPRPARTIPDRALFPLVDVEGKKIVTVRAPIGELLRRPKVA